MVGNYLCQRRRDKQEIWVSKLKENVEDLIQASSGSPTEEEDSLETGAFKEYRSVCLSIDKMTRKVWVPHI